MDGKYGKKSKIFTYHRLESGWKYTENIKIYEIQWFIVNKSYL